MQILKPLAAAIALLACGASAAPTSPLPQDTLDQISSLSPLQQRQLYQQLVSLHGTGLAKRSSPTGSYGPGNVACPATTSQEGPGLIRNASNRQLNAAERDYISRHRESKKDEWAQWLTRAKLDGAGGIPGGVQNYTSNVDNLPRVGLAFSGGGLRAMLVGTGVAMGLDSRNNTANDRGTGGLLQLADYVAGLSGGSWAVSTLTMNDWPTAQTLNDEVWNLDSNLVIPKDGKLGFYSSIVDSVKKKKDAFSSDTTGIVDYWGLAIADKVLNSTYSNKPATTWSDVKNTTNFQQANYPFPIIVASQRRPGQLTVTPKSYMYEMTPEEFGQWEGVEAFIPIEILGSSLSNGVSSLPNGECTAGFETLPWVVGTSATLFSQAVADILGAQASSAIASIIKGIAGAVSKERNDVSLVPNPFYNYTGGGSNNIAQLPNISLVDSGLTDVNLPIWPLVEPARDLDFILAVDSSADVTNWPNGTALWEAGNRARDPMYKGVAYPDIPGPNTFVNRGLNTRPTFFGCDAGSAINAGSAYNNTKTPIIAYLPSQPYVYQANVSTYQLEYSRVQSQGVLDNSVEVATLGGADDTWTTCLGCAMLQRSFERSGTARPSECDACMKKWCWDGVTNDTAPSYSYSPANGVPEFITSNGTVQKMPAYTGGNGSNSDASQGNTQNQESAAAPLRRVDVRAAALLGALTVVGAVLL